MAVFSLIAAILAFALSGVTTAWDHPTCTKERFQNLTLDNIDIKFLNVTWLQNVTVDAAAEQVGSKGEGNHTFAYCQVALTYTHPGQSDTVNTYIGLPIKSSVWNGRFLMDGGGGWRAGDSTEILAPVAAGYASASTDAGHNITTPTVEWGLFSEGNVNLPALNDFASVALDEAATLGKLAVELYYERPANYSYWNGCSTGGRQGHMMAQRYPEQFDGIVAGCPAINWHKFIPAELWPAVMAEVLDTRPPACVLDAFRDAAIAECDYLDGVPDGIISEPQWCEFDPYLFVGQTVECEDPQGTIVVNKAMATLVNAIWNGPTAEDGSFLWYGLTKDTNLTRLLNTTCTTVDDCTVNPFSIAFDWAQVFLEKTRNFSLSGVTRNDYDKWFRQSVKEYGSVIGTDDPDLSQFKKAGGKMIAWHGMQDPLIMHDGSVDYYNRVLSQDAKASDFYRLFLAPGVGHCGNGRGFDPSSKVFDALLKWVEEDEIPETLTGVGQQVGKDKTREGVLCPYPKALRYAGPKVWKYNGPKLNKESSYSCQ
ncbi:Tannase/feruloyl esterase [Thelonectria olida]|uniref:Carboxylic ester hydrolase n=1 Tax=Thelonectria olida TaxID=1576542 RepID=A0A9P8W8R0_9HYPO|nr:Tannase/feruloyl esterase [Thelonectria olida]